MQFAIGVILLIAAAVIVAMTSKGPQKPQPALFSQFQSPQSIIGTPQAIIFGDVWIDDFMVMWYGDYQTYPIYATGKKG